MIGCSAFSAMQKYPLSITNFQESLMVIVLNAFGKNTLNCSIFLLVLTENYSGANDMSKVG